MIAGTLADRFPKGLVLASGYFLAALMALTIVWAPLNVWVLGAVFAIGVGVYVAIEETLEDSFCAELVVEAQHGTAFGMLATINGLGDLASSVVVGLLWTSVLVLRAASGQSFNPA